ncbi:MAG: FtsX-like permease family protein [Tenuifilaceae bacterium]|jgi:putative ABC transport system permease protein|nr:FtsX-like permease family protein [Tenuifilaceae bacterium]
MVLYYLKTAVKSISRNVKFSIINVLGFAFGLSVCMGITLFLVQEISFDRFNENYKTIIRLNDSKRNFSKLDYRVKDIIVENFPQVTNACLFQRIGRPVAVKVKDQGYYIDDIMSVDNHFFDLFTIRFKSGNPNKPFDNNNSAIITASTAEMLFGSTDVLGEELVLGEESVFISGVIQNFPTTSSISAGLIVNAANDRFKFSMSMKSNDDLSSYRWPFEIFLQVGQNLNPRELIESINSQIQILNPYVEEVDFIKLKNLYLFDTAVGSGTKKGNPELLKILAAIAIIILLLAVINYVNLTISQQIKKNKDVGIRKTIGAKRNEIVSQLLFESILITAISFVVGLFFLVLMLPYYNSIFSSSLNPEIIFSFLGVLIMALVVLVIGIASGIGPALLLTRVSPVKALSGNFTIRNTKFSLRNLLTVFQFAVSIVLIFCVMIVYKQVHYVKHTNPGFAAEHLMHLSIPRMPMLSDAKMQTLLDELRKSPFVSHVSPSNGVPGKVNYRMGTNMENSDKNFNAPALIVDTSFLETFKLNVTKGRNLQPGDYGRVCFINEAAYKHFEFENLDGKRFNNFSKDGFEIIGVVNDFHFGSLHSMIDPIFIIVSPNLQVSAINIRFDGKNIASVMDYIKSTWRQVMPDSPLKYSFFDEWFASMYQKEERFAKTIALFALLAVAISCIGILGLAIFMSEQKTKQIGIRKVNGATTWQVMLMLNIDFVKWVAIAFVIATPIAYYAMDKWLQNFAYRTQLSWWVFALAGLMALVIALLTVSWQSWLAARRNPVEALRYE